jgi:large subunit ribosomal protein L25
MLHLGVRVRDRPAGWWTAVTDPDTMIVHVVALKAEEPAATEAAAAPAAATAEPEVIKKGKKEEEEK